MLVLILVGLVYAWAISVVTGPRTAKRIFSVAFSPNGSLLASGADNGTAILWDPASGKRVAVLNRDGYPNWAKFAVFAPQGGILAIGGDSPDVRLVDVETGERRATLTGQFGNSVNCGVFSPKGDTFVTGREHDGQVWSLDPPKEQVLLVGHKQRINGVAFSPDGELLSTASDDQTVKIWDAASGQELATLQRQSSTDDWISARGVAFSSDGSRLAASYDRGFVVLWDVPAKKQASEFRVFQDTVWSLAFAHDGKTLALGSGDGTVTLWDTATNKQLRSFRAHSGWVNSVAFSPDDTLLATGSDDGTAKLWHVTTGDRRHTLVAADHKKLLWIVPYMLWAFVWWLVWKKGRAPRLAIPPQTTDAVGLADREPSSQGTGPQPVATLPVASEEACPRAGLPRQPEISIAILVIGAVAYGVLCLPAIGRRGYPPTHPFWMAMPWLWLAPIVLSAVFDSGVFKSRRRHLAIYALATAFVDAGTMGGIVPRSMDPLIMVTATLFMYGPAHLVVTAVLEVAIQPFLRVFRKLVEGDPTAGGPQRWQEIPVGVRCLFLVLLALTVGFPFAFAKLSTDWEYNRGRSRADEDWANHDAVIYGDGAPECVGEVCMRREYDPETGLPRRHRPYDHGFSRGYGERVAELLQSEGIPRWSMKSYFVPDDELASMLDAKTFEKVEKFPRELNENIVLMRRGTLKRWGSEMTSYGDSLSIATPYVMMGVGSGSGGAVKTDKGGIVAPGIAMVGVGAGGDAAYVARFEKYPKLFFVRSGSKWVGAFHESGRMLASVSRN